ncbi:TlpA family protein disulfide reductase [Micromonospora sp. NPDC050187]|uniref:TlpA family protein disulfide reductase n=1 Tax=Micromonospora sp. NPDC050187 TaxID=3364277 RepID=UPI00379D8331
MNRRMAAALLAPLLAVTGCTAEEPDRSAAPSAATENSPFADCAALTAPPATPPAASPGPSVRPSDPDTAPVGSPAPTAGTPGVGRDLPDLSFACFTGGTEVSLRAVRGPAVINLWASWCPPCRKELPSFQRLHERMAGQVHVIGVNTRDDRPRAVSVGEDFGVTFPTLVDTDQRLQRALAPNVLPITLLVDAQGRVRHQDVSGAIDDARLADLVRRHLGLDVPA